LVLTVDATPSLQSIEVFRTSLDQISPIAQAWLTTGARSFSIWSNGFLIKSWENGSSDHGQDLSALVQIDGIAKAELRVCGVVGDVKIHQVRLNTDAQVITAFVQMEWEQKRLFNELSNIHNQISVLSSIPEITRNVSKNEDLLKILAENIHRLSNADEVCFLLKNQQQDAITETYPQPGIPKDQLIELTRQYQPTSSDGSNPDFQTKFIEAYGKNLLLVPMNVYGAEYAFLILAYSEKRTFQPYETELARAIADYAGTQVEKNNLLHVSRESSHFETEISLAQKIQQSLLISHLPHVDGVDVCLAFEPASRISGDYYDVILGYNNTVYFVIGDISGKGMPAALFMAMTLKAIRSAALTMPVPTPDVIIDHVNETLYKDYNDAMMFSTIFIGQYNPQSHEIAYANAGHSPVIYYPAGEKARMLWADTYPMGLFPDLKCKLGKIRLTAGDILLLATDGINETSNKSSRLFGFTQLMLLVEMLAQQSVSIISDNILEAVKQYGAGKDQEDDRAMLVIKGV
jgi:sigma-B regulation protein RsbU (phosphoserine phosphatase)